MRIALLVLCSALAAPPSWSADKFLCVEEKAVGFRWNGSDWVHTAFDTQRGKYIIEHVPTPRPFVSREGEEAFIITKLGESRPRFICWRQMLARAPQDDTKLVCNWPTESFEFNEKALRFQYIYKPGFVDGTDEVGNTPSVTIGKCSPIT